MNSFLLLIMSLPYLNRKIPIRNYINIRFEKMFLKCFNASSVNTVLHSQLFKTVLGSHMSTHQKNMAPKAQYGSVQQSVCYDTETVSTDEKPSLEENIGVIGFGQMSGALVKGFLNSGITEPEKLYVSSRSESTK